MEPDASCYLPSPSFSSLHRRSKSAPGNGLNEEILNMSPPSSQYSNSILHWERSLCEQCSRQRGLQKALGHDSLTAIASNSTPVANPALELIKEIAVLEVEVMHLEQHLLSLYRSAFNHHLAALPSSVAHQDSSSLVHDSKLEMKYQVNCMVHSNKSCLCNDSYSDITNRSHNLDGIEEQRDCKGLEARIYGMPSLAYSDDRTNPGNPNAGPRSLADHLGASLADLFPETPDRLSEEIVRCMSSIYCKLANPPLTQIGGVSASPISSLSSSSTFSPQDDCDNWSPQSNDETVANLCDIERMKEKHGPYWGMAEISKIHIDDDRFNYAAKMLQNFRSLIQRLEKADPMKMKNEQRLAFWINIHNSLVMHAHLAYGITQNTRTSLTQKAGYNIGGQSINAYVIQNSILGCHLHHSAPWLQALFSPGGKPRSGNNRHIYALDQLEPLVRFALCSGAHSDPAIRVYTAKNIVQELNLAKKEFIQASVSISKQKKIVLPKVLYYFAKDASLDLSGILEIIHDCLPEAQKKVIQTCLRGRVDKYVQWTPYNSAFRYIIHQKLAEGRISI